MSSAVGLGCVEGGGGVKKEETPLHRADHLTGHRRNKELQVDAHARKTGCGRPRARGTPRVRQCCRLRKVKNLRGIHGGRPYLMFVVEVVVVEVAVVAPAAAVRPVTIRLQLSGQRRRAGRQAPATTATRGPCAASLDLAKGCRLGRVTAKTSCSKLRIKKKRQRATIIRWPQS